MKTKKITHKGKLYAVYFDVKQINEGLTFVSEENEFIQVGLWNYKPKKVLPAHLTLLDWEGACTNI